MMINKFSEWRKRVLEESIKNGNNAKFDVFVSMSGSDGGFVVSGSVNGSAQVFVSSQRLDRRVFKNLDTVSKTLLGFDIKVFTVIS